MNLSSFNKSIITMNHIQSLINSGSGKLHYNNLANKYTFTPLMAKLLEEKENIMELRTVRTKVDRCIVLDVDGTLADFDSARLNEDGKPLLIARPGLKEFMEFVFDEFETVIIWTAASPAWFYRMYREILKPNMPKGKEFHYVKTRDFNVPYVPLKPLTEIYELFQQYNSTNTIVVDDNRFTFESNRENAVHVCSFFYDELSKDPVERERLAQMDRGLFVAMDVIRKRIA
jgi:hypothetical protein